MHLSVALLDAFAAVVFLALVTAFGYRRRGGCLPCPPGPRELPLANHFLTFPKNFVWLTFSDGANWRLYDPISYPEPFSIKPERFFTPYGSFRDDTTPY
ncbi:hypothetical protein H4582DRAFT_1934914 [Lactarius indigo]|nr:hypothetical protein H4582DRAFT_1934914 [Lactarius indigo]